MSYNGSGTFLINSAGQPVVANTVISATVFNALTSDLATGLSTAITKDGQTTITNNIPFGSNKITGLGSGTAAADAANLGQVQSTVAKLITVTGTDTITGSMSPQLTAYAAGQLFYFVANAANTGAVTLNIDSLGAKSITRDGSSALAAGDINSGEVVVVIYDGTRFQMINAANSFGNTTINGTLTVTGNAGFQANVSITSALSVGGVFAVTGAATFTANPTLSGGTANGVLYLNGSKVATSGSALVFDGTNLGIGGTPTYRLDVFGTSPAFRLKTAAATTGFIVDQNNSDSLVSIINYENAALRFGTNATERMRIDSSGNVGIGTSTANKSSSSTALTVNTGTAANYSAVEWSSNNTLNYHINANDSAIYHVAAGTRPWIVYTNGSERLRIDSSGNLGLGVTPGTWTLSGSSAMQIKNAGWMGYLNNSYFTANASNAAGTWKYIASAAATLYEQNGGTHAWSYAASGTAGNTATFTQAMTLDASGNLGIGTTTPNIGGYGANSRILTIQGVSGSYAVAELSSNSANSDGTFVGRLDFSSSGQAANYVNIASIASVLSGSTSTKLGSTLQFYTRADNAGSGLPTERARITAGGYFKASNNGTYLSSTGTYHEFDSTTDNSSTLILRHTGTNGTQYGAYITTANDQNDATRFFLQCVGNATERATIRSNGGLANYSANDVNLASDERLKKDISPLNTAWGKVKNIEVVNYRYKDCNENDPLLYGVIAQQVQPIVPELVVVTREATETDPEYYGIREQPMYWLAIKALQEAMTKIEQLEAKVAVLENK